jgi:hypothetical protein
MSTNTNTACLPLGHADQVVRHVAQAGGLSVLFLGGGE